VYDFQKDQNSRVDGHNSGDSGKDGGKDDDDNYDDNDDDNDDGRGGIDDDFDADVYGDVGNRYYGTGAENEPGQEAVASGYIGVSSIPLVDDEVKWNNIVDCHNAMSELLTELNTRQLDMLHDYLRDHTLEELIQSKVTILH
jgi:hypothetical protein